MFHGRETERRLETFLEYGSVINQDDSVSFQKNEIY